MNTELIPEELSDERREQWIDALRILDAVVHEKGLVKATVSAYSGMKLWELAVRQKDGELTVDGPTPEASGSVTDSWFTCHLEVGVTTIGLQYLIEWMESWDGYDQVFFPALLIDGSTCRSHRVGDTETFTFVWE